jgi:hypothetical protein
MLHHALLTLGEMYFLDFELTLNIESVEFHYLQEVLAKQELHYIPSHRSEIVQGSFAPFIYPLHF